MYVCAYMHIYACLDASVYAGRCSGLMEPLDHCHFKTHGSRLMNKMAVAQERLGGLYVRLIICTCVYMHVPDQSNEYREVSVQIVNIVALSCDMVVGILMLSNVSNRLHYACRLAVRRRTSPGKIAAPPHVYAPRRGTVPSPAFRAVRETNMSQFIC